MDYSSQVVDPTPTHDYVGYADERFVGYDRMEEERMVYQSQARDIVVRQREARGEPSLGEPS